MIEKSPLWGRMIFVVGARRSGTNWMERLLTAHPDVIAISGETHLFSHGLAPFAERIHHGALGSTRLGSVYMDRTAFNSALRDLCDAIFLGYLESGGGTAERLVERTPLHVYHLDLIGDVYPDAAVVHIVRDGRDVARSLRSHRWGPGSIAKASEEWRSAIEATRRATRRPERFVEVCYEQLAADPEATVTDLYRRLDLDASPEVIDRALAEASVWYNVDPRAKSVEPGKWRHTLSPRDLRRFLAIAGPTLAELGYDAGPPAGRARPVVPASGAWARRKAATLAAATRDVVSALPRRLRPAPFNLESEVVAWLTEAQTVIDRLLAAVKRVEGLDAVLAPAASVRVIGPGSEWKARGEEGRRRLGEELANDPALSGRQVRGDVFPALPLFTVVLEYRLDDGTRRHRTLVAGVEGDAVTSLDWYRRD